MFRFHLIMNAMILALLCWSGTAARAQNAAEAAGDVPVREIQIAGGAFQRGVPLPDWVRPVGLAPATRTNPVVVRLADTQFKVADVPATFVNRALQVNDRGALGAIGQFTLNFDPTYQNVRLHSVRISRGDAAIDHTHSANIRFLQRETALESGKYDGTVSAVLLLSDVRVGDTLQIQYTIEGDNPVFNGLFSAIAAWDDSYPIDVRSVTLIHPVTRAISWRMVGDHAGPIAEPEMSVANGNRVLRFAERGIDGIDPESYVPSNFFPYRMLQFSEYSDWNAVAVWADGLFAKRDGLSGELKALAERWRKLPDAEARVVAALQWTQDKVRYFSVSLGQSSHRPYPPAEVAERRYGDCKDKTNLLLALLRDLNIEARPVLVWSQAAKSPSRFLPSPQVFDHVVVQVRVDGSDWYLDPTRLGQGGKLSRMGTSLNEAQVLVVDRQTTDLAQIQVANQRDLNTIELAERFVLPAFNEAGALRVRKTWNGLAAEEARLLKAQMTPDQYRKFALSDYEQRYPGVVLDGVPEFIDDGEQNRVTMVASYRIAGLAKEYDGDWVVKYFPGNLKGIFRLPQQGSRKLPLAPMPFPYVARYNLELEWPESVAMMADPSKRKANNDFFTLEVSRAFRGNLAKVDLTFIPSVESISSAQLPRLLDDLREFDRLVGGTVVVRRDAIKSSGFLGIGRATLQDNIRTRLQREIAQIGKAIAGGRLTGHDLARAHCDRGEALADSGMPADGLKDAIEAVRIAPELGRSWACRANLQFGVGQYAKAVSDYGKALSLGEDEFRMHYRRGQAYFYLGKLREAADDFASAAAENADELDKVYADLWQIWTLQRLKRDLPAALVSRATKDSGGAWPRPAAAMLIGALTPEQLTEWVHQKQGDELDLTAAEAYFYLGQHYLVRGKTLQAAEAFEKVRQKGITMYIEHVAAGIELERIKQVQ